MPSLFGKYFAHPCDAESTDSTLAIDGIDHAARIQTQHRRRAGYARGARWQRRQTHVSSRVVVPYQKLAKMALAPPMRNFMRA